MFLLWLIPAVMLVIAILPLPYSYYKLLRWIIFSTALCGTIYKEFSFNWRMISGFVCTLFNPLFPIHLTKEIWIPIDIIVSILYGWHFLKTRKNLKI